ncbi:Uncharacterised protein [Vibrio cholerae]|nr:hypothetical protein VS84_01611 [Vibrio cholerae]KKP20551.1 hypothetical protein VS86_01155 [Vibrio cholerae]CSI45949.1 Uncharacterised protein [Vibrio cholerae]
MATFIEPEYAAVAKADQRRINATVISCFGVDAGQDGVGRLG